MQNRELRDRVLLEASTYEGYRSLANKVSDFGAATGFNGSAWDGSFLEFVFHQAGVTGEPSLVSTVAALGEYHRLNRLYVNPRPGDLVFFNHSTDGTFSQPHIGLVVNTDGWQTNGLFLTIEGQTASGRPLGPQTADGVYIRTRSIAEVLAFVRPGYRTEKTSKAGKSGPSTAPFFHVSQFQPGKQGKSIAILQTALFQVNGATGMTRGRFDRTTQAALAAYQRVSGEVNGTGIPTDLTLRNLASATSEKYFRAKGLDTITE